MKNYIVLLLALILVLGLAACGESTQDETTTASTTEPQITIEDYKSMAWDNLVKIYDSAVVLNQAASYMESYWRAAEKIGGSTDSATLLEHTMTYIEEQKIGTLEEINTDFKNSADLYKVVCFTEIDSAEADAIKEAFEDFYNAYIGLYNMVTSPSGTRESFLESGNEYAEEITNSVSKLEILLN